MPGTFLFPPRPSHCYLSLSLRCLHPHPGTYPFSSCPAPSSSCPLAVPRALSHLTVPPSDSRASFSLFLSSLSVLGVSSSSCLSLGSLCLLSGPQECYLFGFWGLSLHSLPTSVSPLSISGVTLPLSPGSRPRVSGSPPSLGGPGLSPLPRHAPPGLAGVGARSGGCDRAGKENPSRHDIYVRTSKWSRAWSGGGGGWQGRDGGRVASKSQTKVNSGPSLVKVSLVTHTSPRGTLRRRVGTERAILVQSSKKGTSCAPILAPAPSFLPVALQEQLGPLSISLAWEAGFRGWQEQRAPSQQENLHGTGPAVPSPLSGRGLAW